MERAVGLIEVWAIRGSSELSAIKGIVRISGQFPLVLHMPVVGIFDIVGSVESIFWFGDLYIPAYFWGNFIEGCNEVGNLNIKALWMYL